MAAEAITKDRFLQHLATERSHLIAAIAGLSEEQICRPGTMERQSIKDLLAHITFWDEVAIANLELMLNGRSDDIVRPAGDEETSAWNDRELQHRRDLSLAEVIGQLESKRQQFISLMEQANDELLSSSIQIRWNMETLLAHQLVAEDTYEHDKEHAADIAAWRRRTEGSET
jgi:hypothetical protein